MNISTTLPGLAALACLVAAAAQADNAAPSRHQLMKECMAKQKEADSGKTRDDMRALCSDWVKTQRDAAKNVPPKE